MLPENLRSVIGPNGIVRAGVPRIPRMMGFAQTIIVASQLSEHRVRIRKGLVCARTGRTVSDGWQMIQRPSSHTGAETPVRRFGDTLEDDRGIFPMPLPRCGCVRR
jgi:hypothetical protein